MQDSLKYWIWLSSIPGIGSKRVLSLIDYLGSPEAIWNASEVQLRQAPNMTPGALKRILERKFRDELNKNLERIYDQKIGVITIQDPDYPYYLKNIYDPPIALYVKGSLEKDEKVIAVVGSRKATPYGLKIAESLSCELASCGITVISGMAKGIDAYAHQGALKAGGRTIGVMGCGPDIVYPRENKELIEKAARSGAIISEYLPGVLPVPFHFPARNRIISGMALGVVVIEAGERSGSLITANFALEQGRDVFAVPGNVNSDNSKGTNRLIRDGAKLVTSVEDILEELNISLQVNPNLNASKNRENTLVLKGLDSDERKIAECLMEEPLHIDTLARKCGTTIGAVNSLLVMLELKGVVEQLPGKVFKLRNVD
ncbi:MAG: DNA-processing protein DprA [Clostridia bacterium]|nr:DNA-processing protein DprA [Clostridia bacterium]